MYLDDDEDNESVVADPGLGDTAGVAEFQWAAQRQRADFRGGAAVQGFGPEGRHTLFLPPAQAGKRYVFRGGRAVPVMDPGLAGMAQLLDVRARVLQSFAATESPGWLSVDIAFLDYAAAVLRVNYDLTDADLEFLLQGTRWHTAVVQHVLGGDDTVAVLASLNPDLVDRMATAAMYKRLGAEDYLRVPPPPPMKPPAPAPVVQPIPPTKAGPSRVRAFLAWAMRGGR